MSLLGKLLDWTFGTTSAPTVVRDASQRLANQRAWESVSGPAKRKTAPPAARLMKVAQRVKETNNTLSLYLEPEDGQPVSFRAGQFLTCCFDIDGREQRRAYSISSVPGREPLRITVKRIEDGRVSSFVHEHLKVGDSIRTFGPSGDFCLPEGMRRAVFIAGGSGITPIRAMLECLHQQQPEIPVTLLYASRSSTHIIFRRELDALAKGWPSLTIQHVLSRPSARWEGARGRLTPERVRSVVEEAAGDTYFFLCGPQGLSEMAESALLEAGVPRAHILTEHFLSGSRPSERLPEEPQSIYFERAAQEVVAQPRQTLLEAALEAGVELPYSCQVGGCGHCRVRIVSGVVVTNEPNCLSPEEQAQGYRLACQSYACSETRVDA